MCRILRWLCRSKRIDFLKLDWEKSGWHTLSWPECYDCNYLSQIYNFVSEAIVLIFRFLELHKQHKIQYPAFLSPRTRFSTPQFPRSSRNNRRASSYQHAHFKIWIPISLLRTDFRRINSHTLVYATYNLNCCCRVHHWARISKVWPASTLTILTTAVRFVRGKFWWIMGKQDIYYLFLALWNQFLLQ